MYPQNQEITDKYLKEILPLLPHPEVQNSNHDGKVRVVCPFCSHTRSTPSKRKNRTAAFLPKPSISSYTFNCCHCYTKLDFNSFLSAYAPALQRKYHREMQMNGLTGKNCNLKQFRPKFTSPRIRFDQNKSVGIGATS